VIDFQQLKQSVGIEEVARNFLELPLSPHEDTLRGECPSCGTDNPRALLITPAKGLWYCFTKKVGGDLIALVAHVTKTSQRESAESLANVYMVEKKQEQKTDGALEPLNYLEPVHERCTALGFPESIAKLVGVGFAPKGMMRGTVAIPIRMPDGSLIGYIGVTEAKVPKSWRIQP
jgi:DNA primase